MIKTTIRQAKLNDFNAIFSLLQDLWPDRIIKKEYTKNIFSEGLVDDSSYYFISQKNGDIVCFLSLSITNGLQHGRIAIIDELIVSDEYRRQGIGKNMIRHVESFAKGLDCINLELHSGIQRKKAHQFYEKNKFKKVSYYFTKKII